MKIEYNINDDISNLSLSTRAFNVLKAQGINSIQDFLNLNVDYDFLSIPTVGEKTAYELRDSLHNLKRLVYDSSCFIKKIQDKKNFTFLINKYGFIVEDMNIEELELTHKAYNFLCKIGKRTVSCLSEVTEEDLLKFSGVGKTTVKSIIDELNKVVIHIEIKYIDTDLSKNEIHHNLIAQFFNDITPPQYDLVFWVNFLNQLTDNLKIYKNNEIDLSGISNNKVVNGFIKRYIIKKLEKDSNLSIVFFQKKFSILGDCVINKIFEELTTYNLICINEGIITRRLPSIYDYLYNLPEGRDRNIILKRLEGSNYAEIGESLNLSREWIRQRVYKIMENRPKSLYEDSFLRYFEKYAFTKEEFIKTFLVEPYVFCYLEVICEKNKKDKLIIDENVLSDEAIPYENRKNLEKIIYKDYIFLYDNYVKLSKQSVIEYILKNYCKNKTSISDIFEIYKMQIEDIYKITGKRLDSDINSIEGIVERNSNVLKNINHSYRYYNYEDYDFDKFLIILDLEQYDNVEISSLKFFNDYKELMTQYDIRDEYELHNLLKKINNNEKFNFRRMPTIKIGTPNRDEQILNLIIEYAPISLNELALKYEEHYGVKSINFNTYCSNFMNYCHNGVFNIELKYISIEEENYLKTILVDDFYFLSDIKAIFRRKFPHSDIHKINPHSLLKLGFKLNSNYVFRKDFQTASNYFRKKLLEKDIFDIHNFKYNFNNIISYRVVQNQLESEYEIIEFLPFQYINIRKLNQIGITKVKLQDFCDKVNEFVTVDCYFTIHSIYKNGFKHELDLLGFSEYFYENVFIQNNHNIVHKRIGKVYIFKKGIGEISFEEMLEYMLLEKRKIDIYELIEVLYEHYHIQLSKEKILAIIKNSTLYYAPIMEAVYFDYHTYFNDTFMN